MSTSTVRLKTAILARLQEVLPALAAAQDLPPVQEWLRHDPGLPSAERAPQLWVSTTGSHRDTDAGRGATVQRYVQARQLLVGITLSGADGDLAADQLEAYVDLIRSTVEGDQTAGGEASPPLVRWLETRYSPNEAGAEEGLFQAAALTFEIPRRTRPGED